MPSVVRAAQHFGSLIVLAVAVADCSSTRPTTSPRADQRLTQEERVEHVLSRLTFGPRAGDAERIAAIGVDRWISQQLHPESIPDSGLNIALASIPQVAEARSSVHVAACSRNASTPVACSAKKSARVLAILRY